MVTVKAHKTTVDENAIDGETSAELKKPVIGNKHFCEVTFADGTTEISDAFEATHLHSFTKYEEVTAPECGKAGKEVATCDHLCHSNNWFIKNIIWKIVQFFWKLFKMNPVCECGVAHY